MNRKLTPQQADEIRAKRIEGWPYDKITQVYHISNTTLQRIMGGWQPKPLPPIEKSVYCLLFDEERSKCNPRSHPICKRCRREREQKGGDR